MRGFKKVAAEELLEVYKNEDKIKVRRRAGDADLIDSECDKNKCLISDWLVVFFILLFIGINIRVFFFKIEKMQNTGGYIEENKVIMNQI